MFAALLPIAWCAEEKIKEAGASTAASAESTVPVPPVVDPKLRESLKLTDAQWLLVEPILVAKETKVRAELDRHLAAQRVISSQVDAKLAEVLTEEQLTAYFATERKGSAERLSAIAAEIRKRRELRQSAKESSEKN